MDRDTRPLRASLDAEQRDRRRTVATDNDCGAKRSRPAGSDYLARGPSLSPQLVSQVSFLHLQCDRRVDRVEAGSGDAGASPPRSATSYDDTIERAFAGGTSRPETHFLRE